jgi:hypothetical protein
VSSLPPFTTIGCCVGYGTGVGMVVGYGTNVGVPGTGVQ